MILIFWILLIVFLYSYIGYTIFLFLLWLPLNFFSKKKQDDIIDYPAITLLVAAYNEKDIIEQKVQNSLSLDYPKDKLTLLWITDGSDDGSEEILKKIPQVEVLHKSERAGKTAALNRAMKYVKTPLVVFSDANTILNKEALFHIAKRFQNPKVGCVAGEKRIISKQIDNAPGSGEGFYWKYEGLIKTLESKVGSCMGAVGELFALRTELFEPVPDSSIIDDFVISLNIALKGYKIDYSPKAYASETASLSVKEEMKRKIRIASGGFQTLFAKPQLLNVFSHGMLSWQYISHKITRWLFAPILILILPIVNFLIIWLYDAHIFYGIFLLIQCFLLVFVILGGLLKNTSIRIKFIFIPYYFFMMNYAQIAGFIRFIRGEHSVIWEKVKRQS